MNWIYRFWLNIKIPIRNIWRNRKRTFTTIASICVGTLTLLMASSYINMMFTGLKEQAIFHDYGHIQIAKKGYFQAEENSPDLMMNSNETAVLEKGLTKIEEVDFINKRFYMVGLIGNREHSSFFSAVAGLPESEALMSPNIKEGQALSDKDPYGVLIGRALADKIKVGVGDTAMLFFSSAAGSQEAINVKVRGIYKALMKEQEQVVIYMPIQSAWDLSLDKSIHRVQVFLRPSDTPKTAEVAKKIQTFIDANHLNLEVKTWDQLAVFYKQIVGMFTGMMLVIGFILFLVVIFNISNTMVMAIHDRTREIGTLRAMGASRSEIVNLFLLEGIMIGIIGGLTGLMLASIFFPVINGMHITLPPGPGQDTPTPVIFHMTRPIVAVILIIDILTALFASFFPALRGSKTRIVRALREV